MFERVKNIRPVDAECGTLGRRKMLMRTLFGALASLSFGRVGLGAAEEQERTAQPSGTRPPVRVRRVVTGHNAAGKSIVVADEMVDVSDLWKTSPQQPLGPAAGSSAILPTTLPRLDPAVGGTGWRIAVIAPSPKDRPPRAGFHRTATVDYIYVANGEIVLELDEGEVKVKAGEVIVQRNTMHGWRNDGTEPVSLVATLVRV